MNIPALLFHNFVKESEAKRVVFRLILTKPLGMIKRFDSGISISFKYRCNIIMLIQYKKNLNPGRFELDTTLSEPTRSIIGISERIINMSSSHVRHETSSISSR